ncbi:MAG: hypothetical protein IRY97_10970, partial [Thermomicrobiaceae bacterium]|nr:hypothetical protein [Thermomicrobiaceae bacterium]
MSRYGHDPNDGPGARSSGVTAELGLRNSAVVIDVDRDVVRAVLVDAVEGVGRFVGLGQSPATALPPFSDPSIGIARALRALEEQTGRQFLAGEQLIHPQRPDGDGADLYLLTGTPAPPNRVALITAGQSPTAAALVAAARRTHTAIAEAGGQGAPGAKTSSLALATWLRGLAPSTVVLVSADGSAEDWRLILEAVAEAARGGSVRQGIVVAGEALQGSAAEVLGSLLELSGIDPTAYGPAEIASAFEAELRQQYAQQARGTATLRALAETPFVDRLQATQLAVTFLHRRMGRNVLSVSLGDGTRLQSATRRGALVVSHAEADLGLGARALLAISPERIVRWLPFRWSPEEITHWVLNRAWRPQTVLE